MLSIQGAIFALLTIIAWGIGATLDKCVIGAFPSGLTFAAFRSVIIGLVFLGYGLATSRFSELTAIPAPAIWLGVAAAVVGPIAGQATYYTALRAEEASRLVPITASYPLVAAALAVLVLGEKLTWTKGLGIALVILGILLIAGVFNGGGRSG